MSEPRLSPATQLQKELKKLPATDLEWFARIEEHLRSIRSMLKFFVVLAVLAIIVQACTVLLSFGR
jgi:hypothetical protein